MPMHDWTRVEAGIYHHFHHEWISEISRRLNKGVLPSGFYAMAEQQAAGFGPDVLTLQNMETPNDFHRRTKSSVVVRHEQDDRFIAMIDILSPVTLALHECNSNTRAYIETIAVGDELPDMPLFVEPGDYVTIPLESTYQAAWETVPERWQRVIAPTPGT